MSQTNPNDRDTLPPSMDPAAGTEVEPPTRLMGIVKRLGPGLIIAGSIVGSGELIATTKTGAQAGITLLWLIIIGCVIKVFVQIELGRYTISHGETTLAALNRVPGPRLRVNWIIWFWLLMMLVGLGQVGGIVGGVGQSLALAIPMTKDYATAIKVPSENELKRYIGWKEDIAGQDSVYASLPQSDRNRIDRGQKVLEGKLDELNKTQPGTGDEVFAVVHELMRVEQNIRKGRPAGNKDGVGGDVTTSDWEKGILEHRQDAVDRLTKQTTYDDKYWAAIVALITIALLFRGRYGFIQNFATVLVVTFTFVTIGNVISLQLHPDYHIPPADIFAGLRFMLPDSTPIPPGVTGLSSSDPISTALSTFGIIGVGASELVMYPYWCIEKGYAKFTGPRSDEQAWANRARGWMKVMHYDAFASMVIYTTATLAFFLMGVAVMYRNGLDPEGMRMTSTLAEQYVPIFGKYARWLFLAGAVSVLYSTFLVANAGFGRMYADALKVYGLIDPHNQKLHDRWVSFFCTVLPLISLSIYCTGFDPARMVLLGGTMQAMMLPLLGIAALYLRFKLTDSRLKPSRAWDALLIISCFCLAIAGGWKAYSIVADLI